MINRVHIAGMVISAKDEGATHLFVAKDRLDPDRFYGVVVRPGMDPQQVHDDSDNWLVECYALQDPDLPIERQLAEQRPWHLDRSPMNSVVPRREGSAEFDQALTELKEAYADLAQARRHAFTQPGASIDLEVVREARDVLVEKTRGAYKAGVLPSERIRRATGLHRDDVEPDPRLGRASHPQHGREVVPPPSAEAWWTQPVSQQAAAQADRLPTDRSTDFTEGRRD